MKFALATLPLLGLAGSAYAQSESASSAASAASSAASSAAGSASGTASAAMPSGSGMADMAYLEQVLGALTAANLTGLVGVASAIAETPEGMALLGQLSMGNKTVFAPNDAAFSAVPEEVSSNTTLLTSILSYHILNNTYTVDGVATDPMHTIARSLLMGGEYQLPGNRSAPVVLSKNASDAETFFIINESNVTAMGPAQAANLNVYIIDSVLSLPPSLGELAGNLFPQLAGVIESSGLLDALNTQPGLTIFAPNDVAIGAIASQLPSLNETSVQTILANHVINGSVAYSDRITEGSYVSAAGSPFEFMMNDTGVYVMSGNATARIVQTDIIYNRGVVHLIDAVLLNTMADPGAASQAYESATSVAGASMEPTAPVTATSSAAPSGSQSGASGTGNAGFKAEWNFAGLSLGAVIAAAGVLVGGGAVLM